MPAEILWLEPLVLERATEVRFLWRGRPVRVYQRRPNQWFSWCLDDWDNCVDPEWLAAANSG
jgi:hypothetical protein